MGGGDDDGMKAANGVAWASLIPGMAGVLASAMSLNGIVEPRRVLLGWRWESQEEGITDVGGEAVTMDGTVVGSIGGDVLIDGREEAVTVVGIFRWEGGGEHDRWSTMVYCSGCWIVVVCQGCCWRGRGGGGV